MIPNRSLNTRRTLFLSLCMLAPVFLTACGSDDSTSADNQNQGSAVGDDDAPLQASTDTVPGASVRSVIGDVLVFGANNRTMYTFANDGDNQSNCNNGCAQVWPPVIANEESVDGDFSTIARQDNSLQWAFKGRPLYYYEGDASEGETNGEGINGVWYVARPDPIATANSSLGDILVASGLIRNSGSDAADRSDYDGFTLYTFRNDTPGVSNCNGGCASAWPPLYADLGAIATGSFSLILRDDASRQWAYDGQPLYLYQGDSAPGDTNGDGINGVWDVARPASNAQSVLN